ncbi:hypothetical protein RB195_008467 [Necator americanus]|uniref:G-protein coupled receptors family 1 profile domain-containing protein n=1 Tax=Necator americanus TaxID=51031 RepID=A0ABR1CNU1_NECAM
MENQSTTTSPNGMTPANPETMAAMLELLSAYLVLFIFGFICALINIPLLYILFSSKKLRDDSKLLICLAFGDLLNCAGLSLMGLDRYLLFTRSIPTGMVPLETSLSCASKPYMWFRILGNLWPPTVLMIMGMERVFATLLPIAYIRHVRDRGIHLSLISIVLVLMFCAIGLTLSITNLTKGYVKFDCGRKATFSVSYAYYIYMWEMLGYLAGLVLNSFAYIRAIAIISNKIVRDQLKRIRYGLVLGVLSSLLVSVPNMKSLFLEQLRFAGMDEWVSQMFNWFSLINSSINIFVYICLFKDFRDEFARRFRVMPQTMLPANETEIEVMSQGISSYLVLFIMGIVCTFLNIPLLYVLLKSSRFRSDSRLLICLAIGDMINCLALCYLGYNRHRLYMESIKTYMVPMETSRTCAKKAYMWLRLIGNVWPPTVQLLMGAERTLACWAPVFHLTYIRKRLVYKNGYLN